MPDETPLPRRWLVALFLGAALLRLVNLGAGELWYDEAGSVSMAGLSWARLVAATAGDTHPPLYLALLSGWMRLAGDSAVAVRLPSAVVSLLSLWLVYRLALQQQLPRSATLAGLAAMAVMPTQIHYAQEARMYALLQAEVLGLALAVLQRRWWLAGLCALAALYTHNYGLFYVPVIGLVGLLKEWLRLREARQWPALLLALGGPVLLWLPWAAVLLDQMRQVAMGYWIQPVTPGGVIYALYMLFTGFSMPTEFQPAAVMVAIGAVAFALWRWLKLKPAFGWVLAVAGLGPLALAVIGSAAWKPVLLFRGLIGSAPPLYLLIAWALTSVRPALRWYPAAIVAPVLLAGLIGYYQNAAPSKGDVRSLIGLVRSQWQPGDIIYHVNSGSALTWGVYSADLQPQYVMPSCPIGERTLGDLSETTKAALGFQIAELSSVAHRRAWVVWGEGPTSSTCEDRRGRALLEGAHAQPVKLLEETEYVSGGVWLSR